MVVGGRYELGEVVGENEESRTFAAHEMASGRRVLVHQILEPLLESRNPPLRELVQRCPVGRGGVIDKCGSEGADYVVTEVRSGIRDTREWLERAALAPPPAPKDSGEDRFTRVGAWRVPDSFRAPAPAPEVHEQPAASGPPPGGSTALFQTPAAAPSSPPPPQPQPVSGEPGGFTAMFQTPAAAPGPPPPPPPVAREPGDFTRMFQASPPAATPSAPPATPPEPGGFTKMFQAPQPVSPAPPETPPAKSQPGEFTRYFQSSLGSGSLQETRMDAPPASPAAPGPAAAPQPGEYTRLFQTPAAPVPPAQPGSGATRAFVTPSYPAPPPQAPIEAGPSDFTRIIQSGYPPAVEPRPLDPPAAPQPGPAARKPGVPVGLVVLFASLAVLAVVIILVFALRH